MLPGRDARRPVPELAVRQAGAVLDRQDPTILDQVGTIDGQGRLADQDTRLGICRRDVAPNGLHIFRRGGARFVDDHHVGHPQVGFARVIGELVAGPVRVGHDDVQIGAVKWQIVVTAVPQDDVSIFLRPAQDRLVVDSGVNDRAPAQVGLVFFTLFDRHLLALEVVVALEPLDALLQQVAVRHRVAHDDRLPPKRAQALDHVARRLTLTRPGPYRTYADHRQTRVEHRPARAEQGEARARRQRPAGQVHHVVVRDIGVREDAEIDGLAGDDLFQLGLGQNRNALGILRSSDLCRIDAPADVRDLRRREADDAIIGVTAEISVEVVKIAPRGAQYQYALLLASNHNSSFYGTRFRGASPSSLHDLASGVQPIRHLKQVGNHAERSRPNRLGLSFSVHPDVGDPQLGRRAHVVEIALGHVQ